MNQTTTTFSKSDLQKIAGRLIMIRFPGTELDAATASFLRENECDEMQGYLFSRPVPPNEIAAMLDRMLDEQRGVLAIAAAI